VKHYDEEEDEEIEKDSNYEAEEEEDFCSNDEGSLGLDSEDEADHAAAPKDIPAMEENEDLVPLSTRLKRMQSALKQLVSGHGTGSSGSTRGDDTVQDQKNTKARGDAPAPTVPNIISAPSALTVLAAQGDQGVKKLGSADIIRASCCHKNQPRQSILGGKSSYSSK
jgi:hypothetical protein